MIRDHKHVRKYEGMKVRVVVPSSVRKYFRTFEGTVHVHVLYVYTYSTRYE